MIVQKSQFLPNAVVVSFQSGFKNELQVCFRCFYICVDDDRQLLWYSILDIIYTSYNLLLFLLLVDGWMHR